VTLVASAKEITIPYGSLKTDQHGFLSDFHEKPILDYLINCGLYMIHPDALKYIPNNKYFDLTDLISVLLKQNLKVGVYPINDDQWIDVGQWEEYKNAVSKLK
jgi:NDP-sugar pyrophosphorylase family protein